MKEEENKKLLEYAQLIRDHSIEPNLVWTHRRVPKTKVILFDENFKESILNGEKTTTIRNSEKVRVGDQFVIKFVSNEKLAPCNLIIGLCLGVFTGSVEHLLNLLKEGDLNLSKTLGFDNNNDAYNYYQNYLKHDVYFFTKFRIIDNKEKQG
jgi:hypothetical protein